MIVHVSWQFSIFSSQSSFGDRIFGRSEELDGDFSRWGRDRDLEEFDATNFWVGTRGYGEGVLGSIGVVFLVGHLVCPDSRSCEGLLGGVY